MDADELWESYRKIQTDVGERVLGYRKRKKGEDWISGKTWELIEKRRGVKRKLIAGRIDHENRVVEEYREANRAVKRSVKEDKTKYVDNKAEEAENAARRGDMKALYNITKQLTGGQQGTNTTVKSKGGESISDDKGILGRWKEHFCEVLNRTPPSERANFQGRNVRRRLPISTTPVTKAEVVSAVKKLKVGKAPGIDKITAEMIRSDVDNNSDILCNLLNKVWSEEKVPQEWKKLIIVKLPKKGNLSDCNNWRGITLLPVPGKILCRVMLDRMKTAVDKILREEQAGFRAGRSTMDQIFCLRNIIEQCNEWNSSVYLNYIDFEKAFDSVDRESLWNIISLYGIPEMIVNILKEMYDGYECAVRHNGQESEWFSITSGVRQGCIVSPFLFLIVIDWTMNEVTNEGRRWLQWDMMKNLEDLDFADDITLLSQTYQHTGIQDKTTARERGSKTWTENKCKEN